MKKAFKLITASAVAVCLAGSLCFAACSINPSPEPEPTPDNPTTEMTYRFEAENAQLYADESELLTRLDTVLYGSFVTDCVFGVQDNNSYSGGSSVGYLAENNPTITFVINSDTAVTGAQLSICASSMDLNVTNPVTGLGAFNLASASINEYAGSGHDILKLNNNKVTLGGSLPGSSSVFKNSEYSEDSDIQTLLSDLNFDNWGTLTATVDLVQGENTFVFTIENGAGINFDYMEITTTATLTWDETDNTEFSNNPNADVIPPEEDDNSGNNDDNSGNTDDNSGNTEETYNESLTIEAETAGHYNAEGKVVTTFMGIETNGLIKVENSDETERTGTSLDETESYSFYGETVGNINTEGDKVVFAVYSDSAIEDVSLTMIAGATSKNNYVGSEHQVLTVNGESVTLAGTVVSAGSLKYSSSWGYLTASLSLAAGPNYIVFTCDGTGLNIDNITLKYADDEESPYNVYEIDSSNETVTIDTTAETVTLQAETAGHLNAEGKVVTTFMGIETNGLIKVENSDETERTGTDGTEGGASYSFYGETVGNINTEGDKVVFAIYSDSEVSNISLTMIAGATSKNNYAGTEHENVLTVNGEAASLSGTVVSAGSLKYSSSWGYLTAEISLSAGVNYIVFTCDGTGINIDSITLTWSNTADVD
ncbi:MAG: hypothetical protein LUE27_04720 [Clostridia bacterium]|nr:hypothetical protein [Clostridia bacterium]